MSSSNVETKVVKALEGAKDLGWQPRKGGGWSRLLQFKRAPAADIRGLIVTALCLFDGPDGHAAMPDEVRAEPSACGRYLRIRVRRAPSDMPPITIRVTFEHNIFGLQSAAGVA